ncbi:UNVERIFIED_ORG: hypothetical protein M2442_002300 [Methylorubrum zatmanii]|nr:hypothetical protein [Methylorubrum zatmanii]
MRRKFARISGSIWVRLAQTRFPEAALDLRHDRRDLLGREDLEQQRLGALEVRGDAAARGQPRDEIDDQPLDGGGLQRAELHHGVADELDLVLVEALPDRRTLLLAE